MDLKELKNEYYNASFTFKNLYKNSVIYEKKYKNKTVTVYGEVDYRSDLNLEETLSSLDDELDITSIKVS
jgi:predicted choloylglycine hydrolase